MELLTHLGFQIAKIPTECHIAKLIGAVFS